MDISDTTKTTFDGKFFCKGVNDILKDDAFVKKHKDKLAPPAMTAFAQLVQKNVIEKGKFSLFNGLSITVPACEEMYDSPQYHAIVGQKMQNGVQCCKNGRKLRQWQKDVV